MDKFILEIPNALPEKLCNEMIRRYEQDNNKKVEGVFQSGDEMIRVPSVKGSLDLTLDGPNWSDINNDIIKYLRLHMDSYLNFLKYGFPEQEIHALGNIINLQKFKIDDFEIQKTRKNDNYKWHYDDIYICSNTCVQLRIIYYLNTLDYHEGGTTKFYNGRSIKPEVGKLLIFPASWTYIHSGGNVFTDKNKYTCVNTVFLY